jgi:hypothetical protein
MRDTLPDWANELIDCGGRLPDELHDRIGALGEAARGPLVELIDRRALRREDAPGEGMTPVHAVRLLAKLPPTDEDVRLLVAALAELDLMSMLANEMGRALAGWGPAAAPTILAAVARRPSATAREAYLDVLSKCGVRSDAIYELLLAYLAEGAELAPGFLAYYGDARALPELHRRFEALELDPEPSLFANQPVFEFADAVTSLGGTLTPLESAMMDETHALRDEALWALTTVPQPRPAVRGRGGWGDPARPNLPCGCGSGRKFKKCHLDVAAPR